MIARLYDDQKLLLYNCSPHEDECLWREFSVSRPGPGYVDPMTAGLWDGVYRFYNRNRQSMARPLLSKLREVCARNQLPLTVRDSRPATDYPPIGPETIGPDFLPGITLESWQIRAIRKACVTEVGIIDFPTGSGKTEVIAGICKAIPCPTVILADQLVVIDQIKARLELRMVVEEAGLFYAGRRPNGQLVAIGSIQSLTPPTKEPVKPVRTEKDTNYTWKKKQENFDIRTRAFKTRQKNSKLLEKIVKQAHMILVDECVHEDSWIATTAGLVSAKQLERLVLAGDAPAALVQGGAYPITGVSRSSKPALRITTSSNRQLIVSDNHRCTVLRHNAVCDDFAQDLLPGDMLLVAHGQERANSVMAAWRHVGLFMGDGHMMRKHPHRIRFGVRKDREDWVKALDEMVAHWGGEITTGTNKRGDLILCLDSKRFCDFLRELGFQSGRKCGQMSMDFPIPTLSAAAGLLRGLFDAEGTGYRLCGKFSMTDESVVRLGQSLMSYLGITSSVGFGRRKTKRHAPLWRLVVSGENYARFIEKVGFGFRRKRVDYVPKLDSNRLINPRPYYRQWLADGLPVGKLARCLGVPSSELSPRKNNRISLRRLLSYHESVAELTRRTPETYAESKELFGASDARVAGAMGVSVMTAWNRRNRGDDSLWRTWTESMTTKLSEHAGLPADILQHYAVELVKRVERVVGEQPLLDFRVEGVHRFEANGLLVHNCDKCTSDPYKRLFQHVFRGRRRYGFSGTPYDPAKPVEAMRVQQHLGSVIARESRQVVEAAGRIVPVELFMLAVEGDKEERSAYDIAYSEHMVESAAFHALVVGIARKYPNDGTLILVDRKDLGLNIQEAFARRGMEVPFINGDTPKRRRTEILRAFERREYKVLIGGKIINRGLDLDGGCENLILATGGKLWSDFNQKVGRAVRKNKNGRGRIFDFYFRCNKYLYDHSRARLKAMVGMGYRTTVLFRNGRVDGAQLIAARFRVSRRLLNADRQRTMF